MPRRHPPSAVAAVLNLIDSGISPKEAALRTGVPFQTVRSWLRYLDRSRQRAASCPVCGYRHDLELIPEGPYAYLLGAYLGDGHINKVDGSWALRVTLDTAYPWIVLSVGDAIEDICRRRPAERERPGKNCVCVTSVWKSWPCLIPQHGPGRKHTRRIVLADWQEVIVADHPKAFLRGLIHTDGWRGLNRVRVKGSDYAYPRYQFSNRSDDIRRLFTDTCDALGIAWRPWGRWHVSVARREAVAFMDSFIGPKA